MFLKILDLTVAILKNKSTTISYKHFKLWGRWKLNKEQYSFESYIYKKGTIKHYCTGTHCLDCRWGWFEAGVVNVLTVLFPESLRAQPSWPGLEGVSEPCLQATRAQWEWNFLHLDGRGRDGSVKRVHRLYFS